MKKLLLFIVFFTILYTNVFSQITIGTGTSQSQQLPFEPWYGYTWAQSIYTATEINVSGDITALSYYFSGTSLLSNSQGITIYIGHTSKTNFVSTTDWIPVTNLTQVYNGGIDVSSGVGWTTITLDTPFAYNGTDNLVIAFDENMANWDNSSDDFHCTNVGVARSIYYRSDGTNPNPSSPPNATGTADFAPNIMMDIDVCDLPEATATYNCATDAVIVNITNTGTPLGSYMAKIDGTGVGQTISSTGKLTFSGLTPDQSYNVVLEDGNGC